MIHEGHPFHAIAQCALVGQVVADDRYPRAYAQVPDVDVVMQEGAGGVEQLVRVTTSGAHALMVLYLPIVEAPEALPMLREPLGILLLPNPNTVLRAASVLPDARRARGCCHRLLPRLRQPSAELVCPAPDDETTYGGVDHIRKSVSTQETGADLGGRASVQISTCSPRLPKGAGATCPHHRGIAVAVALLMLMACVSVILVERNTYPASTHQERSKLGSSLPRSVVW